MGRSKGKLVRHGSTADSVSGKTLKKLVRPLSLPPSKPRLAAVPHSSSNAVTARPPSAWTLHPTPAQIQTASPTTIISKKLLKQRVANTRKRKYGGRQLLQASHDQLTVLGEEAATPKVHADYAKRISRFEAWLKRAGLTVGCILALDRALADYFTMLFVDGEASADGNKFLVAVMHLYSWVPAHGKPQLPRAKRAIKGWRRLAPARPRQPVPWLVLMALIGASLWRRRRKFAVKLLL